MSRNPSSHPSADEPASLHRTIRTAIAEGLKLRLPAPKKLSHELLVLLMQLNETERREREAKAEPPAKT